ncbi:MAG: alpha/beta hydrolase [Burkholderiales bacterium]|nr:alpha/beta hydrolase [Burkholderiales bacterium]MDE2077716.1 alpha/beta hydrolase [Burkholderiales bacterium]MDE2433141.1 alpha/beta hydrolase [Burkholderiales bacterium]
MGVAAAQAEPSAQAEPILRHYVPVASWRETVMARIMRGALFATFKPFMRPPVPLPLQRGIMHALAVSMPGVSGVEIRHVKVNGMDMERITPKGVKPRHAILYLHGGAFCVGSPRSHRSITTRLATMAQAEVFVPHYRRVPEHPFPAQIDDSVKAYRYVLQQGFAAKRIAAAGDSAGGTLTFMLPAAAVAAGLAQPAALVMISPALDLNLNSSSVHERSHRDPLIHPSWGRQAVKWMKTPEGHPLGNPKALSLAAYPPALIQVGEDEVLFDDSTWAAQALARSGRHAELEVYLKRWHVFHVHAAVMPSAQAALRRQAEFLFNHWAR